MNVEAVQVVHRRIDAALAERSGQWSRVGEEVAQGPDRIGNVNRTAVVGVAGIKARRDLLLARVSWSPEEIAEYANGIGDVDVAIGVRVAATESSCLLSTYAIDRDSPERCQTVICCKGAI